VESTASFRRPARRGQRREGVDGKLRKQRFEVGFLHAICQISSPKLHKHRVRRILVGASGQQGLGAG
jgi:hypothetical protein